MSEAALDAVGVPSSSVASLTPPAETPPAAPPPPVVPPEPEAATAGRFAALARKEKALKAEVAKFEGTRSEVAKAKAAVDAFEAAKAAAKGNPEKALEALEALGISYSELTDHMIGGKLKREPLDEVAKLREELAAKDAAATKAATVRERAEVDAQVEAYAQATLDFVNSNSADYELTCHFGQQSQVFEVIRETFEQHGRVVSQQEAAKLVEDDLRETAKKLKGTKAFAALFAPEPAAPPAEGSSAVAGSVQPKKPTPTLTNDFAAATQPPAPPATSDEERAKRAIAAGDRILAARAAKK